MGVAFGQRLARLRTEQGLTQEELAYRSEVHRTAIANLEKGVNVPRLDTLLKLAAALEVKPGQLIEGMPAWKPQARVPGRFEA